MAKSPEKLFEVHRENEALMSALDAVTFIKSSIHQRNHIYNALLELHDTPKFLDHKNAISIFPSLFAKESKSVLTKAFGELKQESIKIAGYSGTFPSLTYKFGQEGDCSESVAQFVTGCAKIFEDATTKVFKERLNPTSSLEYIEHFSKRFKQLKEAADTLDVTLPKGLTVRMEQMNQKREALTQPF